MIAAIVAALFIFSFFLDGIIRVRTETAMNSSLKGYQVTLAHAHLQLVGGVLTLQGLQISQRAHPAPAVLSLPMMRFQIEWKGLFFGHIVADVLLAHPALHVNRIQLSSESGSRVPLRREGWQDALASAYPFKINRFTVEQGDVVYIQDPASPALHLAKINFTTDNIRNIHAPADTYPSAVHAHLVLFGAGAATIDGHANYLEMPYPGARVRYSLENVPLSALSPEIHEVNLTIHGGTLQSHGLIEYSPKITQVEIDDAAIDGVDIDYIHANPTQAAEARRITAAGDQIEKQNNRPAVYVNIQKLTVAHSRFAFTDKTKQPNYSIFVTDTDLELTHLANHRSLGRARVTLHGKLMGSGDTRVGGSFVAAQQGPAFDLDTAIQNVDLISLNDMIRAYGRFDVAAGQLSVFSHVGVNNGAMSGYVKTLFAHLQVYDRQKDQDTGILHQAKELAIGGAAHLFRNRSTGQVATVVILKGQLTRPDISTWQAIIEVLRNAFIEAIVPGFDRAASSPIVEQPHLAPEHQAVPPPVAAERRPRRSVGNIVLRKNSDGV